MGGYFQCRRKSVLIARFWAISEDLYIRLEGMNMKSKILNQKSIRNRDGAGAGEVNVWPIT